MGTQRHSYINQTNHFSPLVWATEKEYAGAIEKVPQGNAEREVKQPSKAQKSRDNTSYLLHHDLASITQAKSTLVWNPKLRELLQDSLLIGQTRLCGKRVGRALSRGGRPTEPSYSWLPENRIGVQPPGFSLHQGNTPTDTQRSRES